MRKAFPMLRRCMSQRIVPRSHISRNGMNAFGSNWTTSPQFSTGVTNSLLETTGTPTLTGEECYLRAMDAFEKAEKQKQEREEERSVEQFRAWERAQEKQTTSHVAHGVAVIKTIAKQARSDSSKMTSAEEDWHRKAQSWLEEAAFQHRHPSALVRLGNVALEKVKPSMGDEVIREHLLRAIELYKDAGKGGSAEGWFNLGHLLWTGYPNQDQIVEGNQSVIVEANREASLEAFTQAIALGDRDAMYFVGVQLLSDDDTETMESQRTERFRTGFQFVQQAADLGHGGALHYLALLHYNGHEQLNIPACDPAEFVKHLAAAANAGDPDALFLRGHCFFNGHDGHENDLMKALTDFIAAAEGGNADAAISAGAMFHKGIGVKQDQERAFGLYQRAAEMGSLEGWRNVVACYMLGEGVPQCRRTAEYIGRTMLHET